MQFIMREEARKRRPAARKSALFRTNLVPNDLEGSCLAAVADDVNGLGSAQDVTESFLARRKLATVSAELPLVVIEFVLEVWDFISSLLVREEAALKALDMFIEVDLGQGSCHADGGTSARILPHSVRLLRQRIHGALGIVSGVDDTKTEKRDKDDETANQGEIPARALALVPTKVKQRRDSERIVVE